MLGGKLSLPGFDAITCEDVTRDIAALCEGAQRPSVEAGYVEIAPSPDTADKLEAIVEIPDYASDPLVRRGGSLQAVSRPDRDCVYLNQTTVKQLGLKAGGQALIKGDGAQIVLSVVIDDAVSDGSYLLYGAHPGAMAYSGAAQIQISKA